LNEYVGGRWIALDIKVNRGVSYLVQKLFNTSRKEIGVIVVNLLAYRDKKIFYSRSTANNKTKDEKYNPKKISNRLLIRAIDVLAKEGYITNTIAERQYGKGSKKIPSSFTATPLLYEVFDVNKNTEHSKTTVIEDVQRVVLKDKEKRMVGYRENDLSRYS
jgi:hypothetical protein